MACYMRVAPIIARNASVGHGVGALRSEITVILMSGIRCNWPTTGYDLGLLGEGVWRGYKFATQE